jgi:hypothetical protein
MTTNSLIDKLRRRIKDDRPNVKAFTLSVTDSEAERAIAEVTMGHLIVKVVGGTAKGVDFKLDDPRYATIGRLQQALSRLDGYTASADEDAQADHIALDIAPVAPTDIGTGRSAINLSHHIFSDSELEEVIDSAIQRHNPSFTLATLPEREETFVLMLAQADICRRQAYDTSKRRNLDTEVGDLVRLADSIEAGYQKDVQRLSRALVSPTEPVPSTMGGGDIVIGTAYRSSLRSGKRSPYAAQPGPTAPVFVELDPEDVEDENIRIRWARSGDNDFHHFELWMDTVSDVRTGTEDTSRRDTTYGPPVYYHYESLRRGTSNRVFNLSGSSILGQGARTYLVTELEPDCDYFFRLAVKDSGGGYAASDILPVRTKALRTRFAVQSFVSVFYGLPGTVVTLFFDQTRAPLTAGHVIRIGDKAVDFVIVDDFTATLVIPDFVQKRLPKYFVVESPSGLRDAPIIPFQVM